MRLGVIKPSDSFNVSRSLRRFVTIPFLPSITTIEKAPINGGIINGNVRSTLKSF